jgi:hypothetical protein
MYANATKAEAHYSGKKKANVDKSRWRYFFGV